MGATCLASPNRGMVPSLSLLICDAKFVEPWFHMVPGAKVTPSVDARIFMLHGGSQTQRVLLGPTGTCCCCRSVRMVGSAIKNSTGVMSQSGARSPTCKRRKLWQWCCNRRSAMWSWSCDTAQWMLISKNRQNHLLSHQVPL